MVKKNWIEVKNEIENEIDEIFWEEPDEVKMSKMGIYPSGAGVDGQFLTNLFFLVADTQGMGWWPTNPAIRAAIADPEFTVEHCKKMWEYLTYPVCRLLGATNPPGCPAPWLNLPKVWKFCNDIIDSFESIKTKDEFEDLIWSWQNYIERLNRWFVLVFPWHLGKMFPKIEKNDIFELARLSGFDITK